MMDLNQGISSLMFYAAGTGVFLVCGFVIVIVMFLLFSALPSMLFSKFYDRMYKRLGFFPETMLFLLCCILSLTLTRNLMTSPAQCADPLGQFSSVYLYQVIQAPGAPLLARPEGGAVVGTLPDGGIAYLNTLPDRGAGFPAVTRYLAPDAKAPVAVAGFVSREHLEPRAFLRSPFQNMNLKCKPAFVADWRSLLVWPWRLSDLF